MTATRSKTLSPWMLTLLLLLPLLVVSGIMLRYPSLLEGFLVLSMQAAERFASCF